MTEYCSVHLVYCSLVSAKMYRTRFNVTSILKVDKKLT